jgi:hypothetical protein
MTGCLCSCRRQQEKLHNPPKGSSLVEHSDGWLDQGADQSLRHIGMLVTQTNLGRQICMQVQLHVYRSIHQHLHGGCARVTYVAIVFGEYVDHMPFISAQSERVCITNHAETYRTGGSGPEDPTITQLPYSPAD